MPTRKNNINIIIVQRSWGGSEESPNETTTVPSYVVRTYEYIMVPLGFGSERAQMKRKTRHHSVLSDKVFMVLAIHYAFMLVIPPRPRSVRVLPAIVFIAVHLHPRRWFGRKLQPLLARADTFPHPVYHFSFRQQHSRLIYFFLRQSIRPNQCCT